MGIKVRLEQLDWPMMAQQFWGFGYAKTPPVLRPGECRALIELHVDKTRFRSRIDMARHRFGEGEYQYFTEPLPALVQDLRQHAYPPLAEIANCWMEALGSSERYLLDLLSFLALGRERGQTKSIPILLRYETGGYNCLHQDISRRRISSAAHMLSEPSGQRLYRWRVSVARATAAGAVAW
jgi:uncharacterized protein